MSPQPGPALCIVSALLLSACAGSSGTRDGIDPSNRGPEVFHAFPFVDFVTETAFSPAEVGACGAAIPADEVVVIDVEAADDPEKRVAAEAGPQATITSDWVGYWIEVSPSRARQDLRRLLAAKGCDLLLLNGTRTALGRSLSGEGLATERRYLLVAWGQIRPGGSATPGAASSAAAEAR